MRLTKILVMAARSASLQFFTGMRIGETQGRRWRDWSPDAKSLGSLRVHTQYDDQPLKTAKSGDSGERMVPMHPELIGVANNGSHALRRFMISTINIGAQLEPLSCDC